MIVIEGPLLYYDAALCSMLDVCLWLDADRHTCLHRRHQRDCPKKDISDFSAMFRDVVWAHYKMNRETQLANAHSALHLDGTAQKESLVSRSVAHCMDHLAKPRRTRPEPRPPSLCESMEYCRSDCNPCSPPCSLTDLASITVAASKPAASTAAGTQMCTSAVSGVERALKWATQWCASEHERVMKWGIQLCTLDQACEPQQMSKSTE